MKIFISLTGPIDRHSRPTMAQLTQFPGRRRVINIPRELAMAFLHCSRHGHHSQYSHYSYGSLRYRGVERLLMELGHHLLKGEDHDSVEMAIAEWVCDLEQVVTKILQLWLDSESHPPSWDHFLQTLRFLGIRGWYPSELTDLYEEIEVVILFP